jgi:ABC-type lipoprotein export system ATPase subunit
LPLMTEMNDIIRLKDVIRIYKAKGIEVIALSGLSLKVRQGSMVAVVGSSGSGKSTLLNLIGGLDQATAGQVIVDGKDMNKLTGRELNWHRRRRVGFVWQNTARNLVTYLNALENVELAMMVAGHRDRKWARHLLDSVGLSGLHKKYPSELSGGEQQRVALAVALANKPSILLADEPTGALDTQTAESILTLMRAMRKEFNLTVLIVTHDPKVAASTDRTIFIHDGRIVQEAFGLGLEQNFPENILDRPSHELIVVDDRGFLQLPQDVLEQIRMDNTRYFTVRIEEGRIILSRQDP